MRTNRSGQSSSERDESMERVDEPSAVLRTPTTQRAGRLPADLTSFVGRRRERAEVKRLLSESRLVTLTGVGGVGKTRLARRVAADLRRAFQDGVRFVDLTTVLESNLLRQDVGDPEFLAHLVAYELGIGDQSRRAARELLADHLGTQHQLIVLDNCEHLIAACAVVATELLESCPRLRILATSREPLSIPGETALAVPPLTTPDPDRQHDVAGLMLYESVALFTARVTAADPGFRLSQDNERAVAELCQRLDGVPLAIELAAAWLRALGPQQILDRLTDRFAFLNWGNRAGPDRQQTLRACVDWSYELCTEPERLLWSRLSVFAGSCELDAIEAVCADAEQPGGDLLKVVAGLIDKSIIAREGHGRAARYRMLETIREYGLQKLVESGEHDRLRRRHLDFYQQLVARVRAEWIRDPHGESLDSLRRAQPNLRAAVNYCLGESDDPEEALRIVTALPWLSWWWGQGAFGEGRRWLELALAKADSPTALRARALLLTAELSLAQGDIEIGLQLFEEGDQLARRLNDAPTIARADSTRGAVLVYRRDPQAAVAVLTQAREALSSSDQPDLDQLLAVLLSLGIAAAQVGDLELAKSCREETLAITNHGSAIQHALWILSLTAWVEGDTEEAGRCAEAFLQFTRDHAVSEPHGTAWAIEVLAWLAASTRRHDAAATLLGAAETLLAEAGTSVTANPHLIDYHNACERQAREALRSSVFEACFNKGRMASTAEAIAYALGELRAASAPEPVEWRTALTRRERQVSELLAQGRSNRDIAEALVISPRTAENHVDHILTKLGFTSRAQVAAWVTAQHTEQDAG
jgi:predicted ATPase/DNA-binding NarL/FixJ family response regulator